MKRTKSKKKGAKILTGVSGEYFVAAELSRLGFVASITLKNTKGVDVLATNGDAAKSVAIQVKTNSGDGKSWILQENAESFFAKNLFYIFVNLKDKSSHPDFYVVPSKEVARRIRVDHAKWLRTKGKRGQKNDDFPIRKFDDETNRCLSKWDLLGL